MIPVNASRGQRNVDRVHLATNPTNRRTVTAPHLQLNAPLDVLHSHQAALLHEDTPDLPHPDAHQGHPLQTGHPHRDETPSLPLVGLLGHRDAPLAPLIAAHRFHQHVMDPDLDPRLPDRLVPRSELLGLAVGRRTWIFHQMIGIVCLRNALQPENARRKIRPRFLGFTTHQLVPVRKRKRARRANVSLHTCLRNTSREN